MLDRIFYICVELLEWFADKANTIYAAINVIIFVILLPIIMAAMLILLIIKW